MKLDQQDNLLQTSCKDCILAEYNGITQIGCQANRISKFNNVIEAYDEEKEFYVIDKFCNYYRHNSAHTNIDKIKLESQISIDLYLDCNTLTNDDKEYFINFYNSQHLIYYEPCSFILDDIINDRFNIRAQKNSYNVNKIGIHLFHDYKANDSIKYMAFDIKTHTKNSSVSINLNDPNFIHNNIFQSSRLFHISTDKLTNFENNIFFKLNDLINTDLKTCLVIKYKNLYAISNVAYKIIAYQNNCMDYKTNITNVIKDVKQKELYFEIT